jgi:glycine/D-amino acid oxidase-like deaminating enzyme
MRHDLHVAVIGAGAFGGWTALMLRRAGMDVTLVDAWGPGHARASSGGETRILRGTYGDRAIYTRMAARAMQLWREHDDRAQRQFFHRVGALWIFSGDATFGERSIEPMREAGLPADWIDPDEARRRWPHVCFDGVARVLWEPEAGFALARRACEHVVETLVAEGGRYVVGRVQAPRAEGAPLAAITLEAGDALTADRFVFAGGPWLGTLLPDVVGARIRPSRQESFYFGTPAGEARWLPPQMPVWVDYGSRMIYGIPGNANRGFKVADDTYGATFDPTHGDRAHTPEMLAEARTFLRQRFPALGDAPLLGSEVCQYELTSDSHFLIDRHPAAPNAWIVGGGSGHGFKMGPALGEYLTRLVLEEGEPEPEFRLAHR